MKKKKSSNSSRFPSYEDYGSYKIAEYKTESDLDSNDLNLEEKEEVDMLKTNSSLNMTRPGPASYRDIIWQWDDAAWIMCAVLMTFTMQVKQEDEGDVGKARVYDHVVRPILDFAPNLLFQTGFAILEGGCTTLKNEVC